MNKQKAVTKILQAQIDRPMPQCDQDLMRSGEFFDPWELLPCIYGSYSAEFDDVAIEVLENIQAQRSKDETVAHEMFREMLCVAGFCDYGTSPRVCFATAEFKPFLKPLIERWKQYRAVAWWPDE